jgi:hypothetical protein
MASERKTDFRPRDRWLLFALFLAPAAWMLHLDLSFALVRETCVDGSKLKLHILTAVCVAIALVAAAIAWWIRGVSLAEPETPLSERTKWIATTAVILSISMAIVIVAQEIPNVILRSCD